MSEERPCFIGVDVGLTATKAAAFDAEGREICVSSRRTPRRFVTAHHHEIDPTGVVAAVTSSLAELSTVVSSRGFLPAGLGVTGHGNGLYAVDELLAPVRSAIASSDSRGQSIVDRMDPAMVRRLTAETGSSPWAAQPSVLLRWLRDEDPQAYERTRWVLSCKDWVTSQLTGQVTADYSDASAFGMVALHSGTYSATPLELVGLPSTDLDRFPELRRSGEIVGRLSDGTARATRLPAGLPVVAGCMDCVGATVGAGGGNLGDVTIIVGTWSINGAVVSATVPAPAVTLSALMPEPEQMLAMEVAPTSATNLDWLSRALGTPAGDGVPVQQLLDEAAAVPAGSDGLVYLPFVDGSPGHPAASGTFVGICGMHGRGHLTRAVLEGVAQYHRVQSTTLVNSGAVIDGRPWRLAGGGARSDLWAQIFADVLSRPLLRQTTSELGARGVASLLPTAVSGVEGFVEEPWDGAHDETQCVEPGRDQETYRRQSEVFDESVRCMDAAWSLVDDYRSGRLANPTGGC